jgi:hypothetical protein
VDAVDAEVGLEKWAETCDLYAEVPWDEDHPCDSRFIRLTGEAKAGEAGALQDALSAYRNKSDAFVVGNGVTLEGQSDLEASHNLSQENLTHFNVLEALFEELSEAEIATVKGLLNV